VRLRLLVGFLATGAAIKVLSLPRVEKLGTNPRRGAGRTLLRDVIGSQFHFLALSSMIPHYPLKKKAELIY